MTDDKSVSEASPVPQRRDEIISVATQLFADQGYHAVGMRAIAQAVGIRSSSLYHHFPSKQRLLAAITHEYSHEFITAYLAILEGDDPPAERLRRVLRDQIVYFWQHRSRRFVGLRELRELEADQPELYKRIQDDRRRYQHAVTRTIEQGVAAGSFSTKVEPKLLTAAIVAMVSGVNEWFHEDGERTIEEIAAVYSELVVVDLLGARKRRSLVKELARSAEDPVLRRSA